MPLIGLPDHTDYEMIVLTAATSSSFFGSGIASAYVPKSLQHSGFKRVRTWLGDGESKD